MKVLFLVFMTIAVCYGSKTGTSKHLSVRYDVFGGFYEMPTTVKQIRKHYHKYKHAGYDNDLKVDIYSYEKDPRLFVLFDSHGNIGGVRIGLIKEDLDYRARKKGYPFLYDYSKQPLYSSGHFWDKEIWYTDVLFVSPNVLRDGGRSKTKGIVAESIHMKLEGKWTWISKDQCDAESIGFTKQGCFFGMGMHYFYKMTPTTDCSTNPGVFLLFESGKLIGLGLSSFGSFTSTKDRIWFEDPPEPPIKIILPNRPPCLLDWLNKYGVSSIHIFFERYPRFTSCFWPWQKASNCKKRETPLQ